MKLTNKIVVITGAGGLLGQAITSIVKQEGGTPIGADINFRNETEDRFFLDITEDESVQDLLGKVIKIYGRVDGFVNSAYPKPKGYGSFNVEQEPMEVWEETIDKNINGYHRCARIFLGEMKRKKTGSFINIGSIYGMVAPDLTIYEDKELKFPASYTMIKGGIINYTRFLAAYFSRYGVRVNCVSPGGIFNNQPEPFLTNYNKRCLLGRLASPEEIARAICFLLSEDASYIIGHNLVVDGGWSII